MKIADFNKLFPNLEFIPGTTIIMKYGSLGKISIKPVRIRKMQTEVYIITDNSCYSLRHVKSIIEIQKP